MLRSFQLHKKSVAVAIGLIAAFAIVSFLASVSRSEAAGEESSTAVESKTTLEEPMPTGVPVSSPLGTATTSPTPVPSPTSTASITPTPFPIPTGTPTTVRDLSLYENAGSISLGTSATARDAAFAVTRTFVLRKWNARQRGRLALVSTTPTGQPITRHFYVEPKSTGVWRVMLEVSNRPPEEFLFVEEIGVDADGQPILEPLPGQPPPVTRALHLKHRADVRNGLIL